MITVFYDSQCSLCSREISYYQRIASDGIFDWQDAAASIDKLKKEGVSLSEGLRQLHAKDNQGVLHIGVDAFILIWTQLKYWHWLAKLISLPIIKPMTSLVYEIFANWRFKRLKHCQLAIRQEKNV